MQTNINNVINVSMLPEGLLAARDNMNVCAVLTSQQDGGINTASRYALYRGIDAVAADFGTASNMYAHASAFFGTQPNPVNAGGVFVAGYWRGAAETVAAASAILTGAQLSEATVVSQLQAISNGSLDIDVDGTTVSIAAMDLRTVTSLADVATLLDSEVSGITGAAVTVSASNEIVVTSATTGVLSLMTVASDPATGTFIGTILGLSAGSGAVTVQGAASVVLAVETKVAAITALKAAVNIKGAVFIDNPTDIESKDLATWAQANSVLMYDVFSAASALTVDPTSVVWDIKLSSLTNYRMLFSHAGNRLFATAYMARAHTVNFNAENSALTMHLKALPVAAESYSQTEIANAKMVGLDIYTTIKNTPIVLTSGANDFQDNRYNIIAFIDAVQTDMYNLLKLTSTKIPQTQRGVNQLIDQGVKTTRGFVRAGVFAAGSWSSPDYFGDRATFERNILTNGFYWIAGKLADQPQADRQARKSPTLQAAVKNAGAIHSADIIVNFNL
ncbi:MAG: DUF3383 family protein [Methylophaga sp.]|nr:DUF3383 family protein [Methylophaga sp.]